MTGVTGTCDRCGTMLDPDGSCLNCSPYRATDIPAPRLADVHRAYRKWLGDGYDLDVLDAVLCTAAAGRLDGDPPWVQVVGGSGHAKTETVVPLAGAGAFVVSTISGEAALLSGTSARDRAKDATGGMLRAIGDSGVLIIKDFTSVLSMNRDTRALVLAALREIYDGQWSRNVGTDGGKTLRWSGRLVLIGAVTTAWDSAHQVVATMGDRFVVVRLPSTNAPRREAGRQAMRNVSSENTMRAELSESVAGVLGAIEPGACPVLADSDLDELLDLADVVTRARTPVERDFRGDPAWAHALEMPTRFAKQLVQITRGGIVLGMTRDHALAVAARCARDSMPPLRQALLGWVACHPGTILADVVKGVQMPRRTVDRTLQELHLLGLLHVGEMTQADGRVRWAYTIGPDIPAATLALLAACRNVSNRIESETR